MTATHDQILNEVRALAQAVAVNNEVTIHLKETMNERHENTKIWRKGHDERHAIIESELSCLKSDADKGRGAIKTVVRIGAFITALSAIAGTAWAIFNGMGGK